MNQTFLSSKGQIFTKAGLSLAQIHYWNKIQAKYSKSGFVFIEYEKDFKQQYIWKCYLTSKDSKEGTLDKPNIDFDGDAFNSELTKHICDRESYNNSYWETFMKNINWSGYLIPVDDFKYFTNPEMESELNHSYLLCQHFQADDFLISIKKDSIEDRYKDDPIAIFGIWHYLTFYANYLFSCFENDQIKIKPILNWHSRNVYLKKFYKYLPTRQLSTLLMIALELGYDDTPNTSQWKKLIKYAHPIVSKFIDKYIKEIESWIHDKEGILFTDEMKTDFIDCCRFDRKIITTIETIEDLNFAKIQPYLPEHFKVFALKKTSKNIFTTIRKALADISILDVLWFDLPGSASKPQHYLPKLSYFSYFSKIKWYHLEETIIDNIYDTLNSVEPTIKTELYDNVNKKWAAHLTNVSNCLTPPIFIWNIINGQTVPNWNIFDNKNTKKNIKAYYKKQENLAAQKRRFKKVVFELEKLKTTEEIDAYVAKVDPFLDSFLKSNWKLKVTQHSNSVQGRRNYRQRRMVELGIKKDDDIVDYRTELWLDEMLQIEDEVRKYIPFVKKAFTAALPIRKTIEFNSERHVQTGIEFDPNTINDQNKWLRGEVMKTFKSTTKLGEIEQINAFCLDFSGSMKHDRMRNLFKILYLLVLGLEDRKSFDAFHFFNSSFIEGLNFTEDFTRRSLLFKILSKVSEITDGKIKYGGHMGTNIGAGILECHNRIHNFKDEITQKKPNSNFVCSMFVITDGEPSVGIIELEELNDFIQEKRNDGEIAIKGIYIKTKEDENNFMESIFGSEEFVETVEFGEAVNKFVNIMTKTYREQRSSQKWKIRKNTVTGNK